MLTIQSFLLKFRNRFFGKELKKNVKYAMLICAYVFIAVFMVLKFNVFKLSSKSTTLEAFAAQTITTPKEETNVLNEVAYLNQVFNQSTGSEQKTLPATVTKVATNAIINGGTNYLGVDLGQVTMMSADIYVGDLNVTPKQDGPTVYVAKDSQKIEETKESKEEKKQKSAAKEKVTEEAKETMNTEVAVLSLSTKEIEILQRIVEAEATGEDLKGKILVANVIMNRVHDSSFPDSVEEVVFQKTGGTYQFSPISDRRYYSVEVTKETKEAVQKVICGEDYSQGALYFSARKRASAKNMRWFDSKLERLFQYGGHEFFKHK